MGRAARGSGTTGECTASYYGSWGSSFAALVANISAYQRRVATPPPPPAQPVTVQVTVSNFHLVSAMGSKCLGVEGGNTAPGSRIILWNCLVQPDQNFVFTQAGEIRTFAGSNMCVEDKGGLLRSMDGVDSWPCNGGQNQKWRFYNGQLLSVNGMCIDLRGGTQNWYIGNQDAILYQCNGQVNQHFVASVFVGNGTAFNSIQPGVQTSITAHSSNPTMLVGPSGGTLVASGAGNLVASGAGNLVASGAGNLVASGAGNIVVNGGQLVPVATGAQLQ
jgi:hypothetical protein